VTNGSELGKQPPAPDADELFAVPTGVRRTLQVVFVVAVPAVVVWFVWANWDEFTTADWTFRRNFLAFSLFCYLVSELLRPLAWYQLMRATGTQPRLRSVAFVWFAVEPTYYLPLPIGPFLGRYTLADRVGLSPVAAVVTIAYEFSIGLTVAMTVAFPVLVWLAFTQVQQYQWAVWVLAAIVGLFSFAMLRRGGIARTLGEMLGPERAPLAEKVAITRRDLVSPVIVTVLAVAVRTLAAGALFASLTDIPAAQVPVIGLIFVAGAAVPFGRFGTREGFIIAVLTALGAATAPAALAAVATRAVGLAMSLLLLGVTVIAGGGRRVTPRTPPPERETPPAAT
jgi:hypothetical protein